MKGAILLLVASIFTTISSSSHLAAVSHHFSAANGKAATPDIRALASGELVSDTSTAPQCDVEIEGSICLHSGKRVILPAARQEGCIAHFTFDESEPVDTSGLAHHGSGSIFAAPAFGGVGSSALFRQQMMTVPHSPHFDSADFSVTFWMFLLRANDADTTDTKGLRWCPLLHKGVANPDVHSFEYHPEIALHKTDKRLRARVTTTANSGEEGESLVSNARLNHHTWTHVALVRHGDKLRLYVNGILDAKVKTAGVSRANELPLYVGSTPLTQPLCDVPLLLDELRVYNRPLGRDEIQAEAAPALGGTEPSFIRLACLNCTLSEAVAACPAGYHICNSLELHSGGYQVARGNGYVGPDTELWTQVSPQTNAADGPDGAASGGALGLGLCCRDAE
ncbi:unnamed protein product [Vitrella brassicaformis CCMP3155]|uniref:LamG-like jellyroll fold domain-containing protein n=2 Tax=Vitrella brassicaformis TaxID=1169539 RepID=A0A0G4GLE6_VITBC|nr:unnamed protein product [Vitrella brassicaformis CCMP3155]|eukprot:CEM30955.1 unnamed protein product [Vitrella brassicaformis CCMP3155]